MAAYSISIDPSRGLLRITLSGFFDLETVARFAAERDTALDGLCCGRNRHVTLCDIREQKVSPRDVSEAFRHVISDPRYASRRLAFVVTGALERMSVRRIMDRADVGYFTDIGSAETWLFTEDGTRTAEISAGVAHRR